MSVDPFTDATRCVILRAEIDALKLELYEADLKLVELREAAAALAKEWRERESVNLVDRLATIECAQDLEAVLAKLQPAAAHADDATTYRELPLERDTDPTPPNTDSPKDT